MIRQPTYSDIFVATVPTYSGTKDIRMNIYLPENPKQQNVMLLYIHGGAFMFGDYTMQSSQSNLWPIVREEFPKKGIAVVSLSYRLATEACFPAQIHDIKGCVRFIRKHGAEYGLATERLGVLGESAGGFLTAMLALSAGVKELEGDTGGNLEQSSSVQYAAPIYGVFNMLTTSKQFDPTIELAPEAQDHTSPLSPESRLLGLDKINMSIPELLEIANDKGHPHYYKYQLAIQSNPATHVTKDAPPMFIGHGDCDSVVPIEQSVDLYSALCRTGVDAEFVIGHLQDHGRNFNPRLMARIVEWITEKAVI